MNPNTYTIIVKGEFHGTDFERMVKTKLELPCNVITARIHAGETMALVHVGEDSSRYGHALANWLGEEPFPPYSRGSLLWYR